MNTPTGDGRESWYWRGSVLSAVVLTLLAALAATAWAVGVTNAGKSAKKPASASHVVTASVKNLAVKGAAKPLITSNWSIKETPSLSGPGELPSVSCTSVKACSAVGYEGSSGYVPLAERWDGTKWSLQTTPSLSGRLSSVSCSAAESCIAVGELASSKGTWETLAEQWNGKEWSVMTTPNTAEEDNVLVGVSCTSAEACTAVGYDNGTGAVKLLAERWNGKEWAIQEPPTPKSQGLVEPTGVSCSATEACTAAGFNVTADNVVAPLAERWNGKEWVSQEAPKPKGLSYLRGVSCPALEACVAVGDGDWGSEGVLAEQWNGKAWSEQATPAVAGGGGLLGVSCVSTEACTAVGFRGAFTLEKSDEMTLVEQWNGKEWAIEETPDPAEAKSSLLQSVSCPSAGSCIAAGEYVNSAGVEVPLIEED
jgi:hypothetical protein